MWKVDLQQFGRILAKLMVPSFYFLQVLGLNVKEVSAPAVSTQPGRCLSLLASPQRQVCPATCENPSVVPTVKFWPLESGAGVSCWKGLFYHLSCRTSWLMPVTSLDRRTGQGQRYVLPVWTLWSTQFRCVGRRGCLEIDLLSLLVHSLEISFVKNVFLLALFSSLLAGLKEVDLSPAKVPG